MEKQWNANFYGSLFHTNFHTGSLITVEIVFYILKKEVLSKGHNLDIAFQENIHIVSRNVWLSKKIEEKKQKGLLIFASATFSMVEKENRRRY